MRKHRHSLAGLMITAALVTVFICNSQLSVTAEKDVETKDGDETSALVDAALYTRYEFLGAQAIVPYPTAEARNRLAAVMEKYPDKPQILLKLAQLDEKLGREEEALREMQSYVEHESDKQQALTTIADFFHRRAQFSAEAESLERLLRAVPAQQRLEIFRKLIELAEMHRLTKYLSPSFYEQIIKENPAAFEIVEQYQRKLTEQGNYEAALTLLRQNKDRFPDHRAAMIASEVSLLDEMGRAKEAESVYMQAFDPFWSTELSESFYEFLKDHDRFRSYGHELRDAFRRNPTDFTVAVRLLHYSRYTGLNSPDVFVQLEKARAARHIVWKPDELITITRLLLSEGYGEAASRFLYTLYLQGELKPGSPLRARVLYQLFELLSDAGEQRLALTRGDLKFYQDIATADPHPGILNGILSFILSDTHLGEEFALQEARAIERFNRAAAYRIFLAYKLEYPTAPELAQMYLDIVRLYSATKDVRVAAETLAEFEQRYADAPEYAEVALKLADCYITVQNFDAERAVYQRILDYLGQRRVKGVTLVPHSDQASASNDPQNQRQALDLRSEPTTVKPVMVSYPPISNPGISFSGASTDSDYSSSSAFPDYLESVPRDDKQTTKQSSSVDYQTVLSRYVASLAKDNRTTDILALYSGEVKKYPDEQGLYEQMLQWLGQTNLVDEQLRIYQLALRTFPSMTWHDRLARWFIRQKRTTEFETLSRELLAKVNDKEAERYLQEFVRGSVNADPASFDAKLYVALYSLAHQRFPHNLQFVSGLLQFYVAHQQWEQWRMLVAEYYFESQEVRDQFLSHLASHNELRKYLSRARETLNANTTETQSLLPYKLFRADAAARLSNYEEAIDAYRELNRLYPNSPEFAERLVSFTRSFGQHNQRFLEESATISHALADAAPSVVEYRTRAGELQAELGDYNKARGEWEQLIPIASGNTETYLDTATIYWDYFQYDDAMRTIQTLRRQMNDPTLYAFQVAVILEDKHQLRDALPEYVKALMNDDYADAARARKRLVALSKKAGVYEQIVATFNRERNQNHDWEFVWEYANFLNDTGRWPEVAALLRDEVSRSDSSSFLTRARAWFEAEEETAGQVAALERLIATTKTERSAISYRLQLAEIYSRKGQRAQAAGVLHALVTRYPNNYGVLSESADFFWRLGLKANAVAILQSSMQRGIGRFHYVFGRKLAARQVEMQQFASAQQVLEKLNREDRLNIDVFRELAKVCVHSGNQEGLRTAFGATIQAIKKEDTDPRDTREQIAQLRKEMIGAFTRLRDYPSAVEQHIEIINRDPDDEKYVDAAINYVRRYGGGDTLLNYYQRISQQAFKNYRWNVVLARIYEAQGDVTNAARQYRAAIDNQPEMIELYDFLADLYTKVKDYDSALAALRKAQEFSNDDPQNVNRTIAVLEKAGRQREADAERRKLPPENVKPFSVNDQFAAAAQLRSSDPENAVATYRRAYEAFVASPFNSELKAADIAGYVQTVRSEERLDEITKRLWELRHRIVSEAETKDSTNAGKARSLLTTLDGAVVEAVGDVAEDKATGDELASLFRFLHEQINTTLRDGDKNDTLAFLRNLSRRAGFGSIDEEVLTSLKDRAYSQRDWPSYNNYLRALVDLYDRSGAYRRILDLLQAERARNAQLDGFDYVNLIATNARLLGDSSLELQALREHYQKPAEQNQLATASDPLIERYFEALWESGESGRAELLSCAQHSTSHQLQLITFLLTKEDKELVHVGIANSPLSAPWKASRNAEVSLELSEFDATSENYFAAALKFQPIGELIRQKQDTSQQLAGDDWYQLAQTYGRWLYSSGNAEQKLKSQVMLPARMENRPHDIDEQARLGRWYLERQDLEPAIEYLALANASQPDNKKIIADLGSAFFLRGDKQRADQLWEKILNEQATIDDYRLYLNTLIKNNLNEQARKRLTPLLITRLKKDFQREDEDSYRQPPKQEEDFKNLIRALAESFSDSKTDAKFFAQLCAAAPDNTFLPALLVRESLVPRQELGSFYQVLIERSAGLSSYESDYSYTSLLETTFDDSDAESALDQESGYKREEPETPRIKWQRAYLDYLIEERRSDEAKRLIASVERDLQRRYACPVWLRLAAIRLDVQAGRVAQALDQLQWLIAIKTDVSLVDPKPPGIERLNDAIALLRDDGRETEARKLLEAAYARGIALGTFEPVYFTGLARIAFERGDKALALTWVQSLVDLTAPESKEQTVASLMAMPLIAAHTASQPQSEEVQFDRTTALRLAAETAGEFAAFAAAIDFRQQLLTASPADEENRIELIRLLDANGKKDEAVQNLSATIADRNTTRTLRWQAVWLTPEIAGTDTSVWVNIRDRVRALNAGDSEMNTALEALSLSAAGRADEAIKLIAATEINIPNEYLSTLQAIFEKRDATAAAEALNSFTRASIAAQKPTASQSFNFIEDEPLEQIVGLYLKQNQPRAALKFAERVAAFQTNKNSAEQNDEAGPDIDLLERYQTLSERAAHRARATRANLLAMLSAAAEQIGDLNRAEELERLRLALIDTVSERKATRSRLDHLQQLQNAAAHTRKASLVIDQKLATDITD